MGTLSNLGENGAIPYTDQIMMGSFGAVAPTLRVAQHGDAADDAAALIGVEARTTLDAVVDDGDITRVMGDSEGRVVVTGSSRAMVVSGTATLSTTTETVVVAAGDADVFHDLSFLDMSNTSSTKVRVDIRDAVGGTVRLSRVLGPNDGATYNLQMTPWPQDEAANAWTVQLSGAVADVRVSLLCVKRA